VKVKRVVLSAIAFVGLIAGLTSSIAEAAEGVPVVETSSASFVLSSASCPNLPARTTINGSGTQISITTQRTDRSGVKTVQNTTITNGTATDDHKNTYVFHYANEYRIANTPGHPDQFSGSMTDVFGIAGAGPLRVNNGFAADLTVKADPSTVTDLNSWNIRSWKVRHAFGDPISFEPGPFVAHCDPL
jgi:hypothetical protein